jgi:Ca2+-transporting ATPase
MAALAAALAAPSQAPLVGELRRVAFWMSAVAVGVGAALVPIVLVRSQGDEQPWVSALLTGVALAVAALPEGLATVVVGALAVGAHRLAVEGAVVRELAAVEALGVVDVLCTDKTGTLTTGTLSVATTVVAPGHEDVDLWISLQRCIDPRDGTGDPLDVAIGAALPADLPPVGERLAERPFDPAVRSMATVVAGADGPVLVVKGAPEAVLPRCRPGAAMSVVRTAVGALATEGMRVLVVATRATDDLEADDLDLVGAVALHDGLRPTAADAVERCHEAGIRLVMVTGDHPATARAVGRAVGIEGATTSGPELADLDALERDEVLRRSSVVARVDPLTKVALVDAHRAAGAIVAMTGDGVNDAPALRRADVGVAVAGAAGTDVAREAAQLVVTNGDLGTLVSAVGEGRRIRANLRAVVAYLLAGNLSEVFVVIAGVALVPELAVPLLPVQLLWCNLITDGVPALALGVDRPPSDPLARGRGARTLLDAPLLRRLVTRAAVMASAVLATGVLARSWGWSDEQIRSQLLLSLVVVHLVSAYAARARRHAFERGWWRNRVLAAAILGSLALQVLAFGLPFGRVALGVAELPAVAWALAAGAATASLLGMALVQLWHLRRHGEERAVPHPRPTA